MWIKHDEDNNLPSWLKDNLVSNCGTCGSPIENFYNKENRCTARRCSNPICPSTLAARIVALVPMLGWTGIGPETAMTMVISNKLTNHMQAIPLVEKELPEVPITKFLKMCLIQGMQDKWDSVGNDYESVEQFIETYRGYYSDLVKLNKDYLLECSKYVRIKQNKGATFKYDAVLTGNVMITGSIDGFPSKEDYLLGLAAITEGMARFTLVGKRKTNVMALIKEEGSDFSGKYQVAVENNIPIYTSAEFTQFVLTKLMDIIKSRR